GWGAGAGAPAIRAVAPGAAAPGGAAVPGAPCGGACGDRGCDVLESGDGRSVVSPWSWLPLSVRLDGSAPPTPPGRVRIVGCSEDIGAAELPSGVNRRV
ncbi:MAG: hypothetical protein AAGF23_00765, partial [Acidobacteriota bacterium]